MTNRRKLTLWLLAGVVLLVIYMRFSPSENWWMPKCPIKLITGLQCPGCGMQRFVHALLQGHLREAISYNYFLIFVLPYLSLFAVREFMPQGRAREKFSAIIEHKVLVFGYIVAYFVWFAVRNIYGL